jgi:XTP/dITP diphosphohydrolase
LATVNRRQTQSRGTTPTAVKRLLFLTGNSGKLAEAQLYFGPLGFKVEQFLQNGQPPEMVEPQAETLRIVANWKINQARKLLEESGETAAIFVDDSGLFIDSLNGFPGVNSAPVHQQIGCRGILDLMKGKNERGAEFRTCAILWDGVEYFGEGVCRGEINVDERGENGFGYDPIFVPADIEDSSAGSLSTGGLTFAEIQTAEKNAFSHRRKALEAVAYQLK